MEESKDGNSGQTFEERQQEIKDHEIRLEELNTLKHRYFLKFKEVLQEDEKQKEAERMKQEEERRLQEVAQQQEATKQEASPAQQPDGFRTASLSTMLLGNSTSSLLRSSTTLGVPGLGGGTSTVLPPSPLFPPAQAYYAHAQNVPYVRSPAVQQPAVPRALATAMKNYGAPPGSNFLGLQFPHHQAVSYHQPPQIIPHSGSMNVGSMMGMPTSRPPPFNPQIQHPVVRFRHG